MKKETKKEVFIILHNVRSVFNVGSIFRTADALGVSKIFLTGYTPSPKDRFGRDRKDLSKSALGAEKNIAWESFKNPSSLINRLKENKVEIIAVEQSKNSIDYKKIKFKFPVAFLFGNEVNGIPKSLLEKSDKVAEIPMKGKKESLNVGVSVGISLFRILNV